MPTFNRRSEQWGEILRDEVMAAALPDRLAHRRHTVGFRGNNHRMRRRMELFEAVRPTASRAGDDGHARQRGECEEPEGPASSLRLPTAVETGDAWPGSVPGHAPHRRRKLKAAPGAGAAQGPIVSPFQFSGKGRYSACG